MGSGGLSAVESLSGSISIKPPFDFHSTIHSHRYKRYHPDRYDRSGPFYKCAFLRNGRTLLAELRSSGTHSEPRLKFTIRGENLEPADKAEIRKKIAVQFCADLDLSAFYRHVRRDPVLYGITKIYRGLRPTCQGDLFECLVRCIISQQINVTFADKVEMVFVQTFGTSITSDHETFYTFPTPERIAGLKVSDLTRIQFSGRKAEYVIGLAKEVASGRLKLDAIGRMPQQQFTEAITVQRGIGRWTAECALMHLQHWNIFPIGDVGLHHAVRRFYKKKLLRPEKELPRLAKKWSGWEGLATYYLWHALMQARSA